MLKIYGSMLCKDCVQCLHELDKAGVLYTYLDFSDDLRNLKEFLVLRETLDLFASVKEAGGIGIPCLVEESGEITLSWEKYI